MRKTTLMALGLLILGGIPLGAEDSCHIEVSAIPGGAFLFGDRFESGDLSAWQPDPDRPRFSARATDDLLFSVSLDPGTVNEEAVVRLRMLLPSGDLFQEMAYPVATASSRSGDDGTKIIYRRVRGYPYPVPERILSVFSGRRGVEDLLTVPFPIGGTQVIWNSLYGEWTVQAFLGDAEAPCGQAARFVITE